MRHDDAAVHRLRDPAGGGRRAADDIADIVCEVAEGTVHRLWEPLAVKRRPPTPYAAKFSTPFCMAVGFLDRKAGLAQFSEARIHDPAVLALAAKIRYRINPDDEYPRNFTGHLRATLKDGSVRSSVSPACAAARARRCRRRSWRRSSWTTRSTAAGAAALAERFLAPLARLFSLPRLDAVAEFRA